MKGKRIKLSSIILVIIILFIGIGVVFSNPENNDVEEKFEGAPSFPVGDGKEILYENFSNCTEYEPIAPTINNYMDIINILTQNLDDTIVNNISTNEYISKNTSKGHIYIPIRDGHIPYISYRGLYKNLLIKDFDDCITQIFETIMEKNNISYIMKNESNGFAIMHTYYVIYEGKIIRNSYIGFAIDNHTNNIGDLRYRSYPPLFYIYICPIFNAPIIDVTPAIDIYELNQALNNTINDNIIIISYQVEGIYVYGGIYCKQIIFNYNYVYMDSYQIFIDISTNEIIVVTICRWRD